MGLYGVCPRVRARVCKLRYRCPRVEDTENRPLLFLLQSVYPSMFIQADEGVCVTAGKTTVVFLPFQSLLSLTDNGITHQRSYSLYPILL